MQTVRGENPQARVLVGPVRPWNWDQNGVWRHAVDAPWLNYMNTLVAALDEGAKAAAGIPLVVPDGFAVQAPGRPGAAEMAGREGAEVQRRGLGTRVLALSAYRDEKYVWGMLEAGAAGYLVKEEAPGAIVAAVRAAAKGQGWFSPGVAAQVAAWARGRRSTPAALTEREQEVLRLVARGKSNKEIALRLRVAEGTAEFHVTDLLRKLDLTSRVEAAIWAKDHGWGG